MTVGDVGRFFVVEGYIWDWATAAACILINLLIPGEVVKPLRRYYENSDATLSYPERDSSVPSLALYLLVFVLPAVVFAVTALIRRTGALVDWHHAALSIAEGFALTTGFKRWVNLVGRLRPNWLAMLALNDAAETKDARQSYPSGHSAYMFFSMTILSLYLIGKLELMHRPSQLLFLKAVLAIAPMALATFVAISRIADYKHHPSDVNAGCFIGIMCGGFAYFLQYPWLFDPESATPKRRGPAAERMAEKAAAAAAVDQFGAGRAAGEELEAIYSVGNGDGSGLRGRRGV